MMQLPVHADIEADSCLLKGPQIIYSFLKSCCHSLKTLSPITNVWRWKLKNRGGGVFYSCDILSWFVIHGRKHRFRSKSWNTSFL